MKNLISSEMYKWSKSKSFVITTIIGIVMAIFTVATFVLLSFAMKELGGGMDMSLEEAEKMGMAAADYAMMTGHYDGELIFSISYYQTSLQLLIAVFVAIFVAGEFSNGTIKMMISRGYSRTKIYMAKLISGIIAGNVMGFIIVGVATLLGTIIWGWNNPKTGDPISAGNLLLYLLIQILLNSALIAVFVSLSMMFRNLGASIALSITSYSFGGIIFTLMDAIIRGVSSAVDFNVDKLPFLPSEVWLVQTIANMSKCDFTKKEVVLSFGVFAIYTLLFTLIGVSIFRKKDIK